MNNATIRSWERVTATDGAGEPVRETLVVNHPIPCELVYPSAARKATERAAGVALSRVVLVPAAALRGVDGLGDPVVGDRLTVALVRKPDVRETLDIVETVEQADEAGVVWECKCGERLTGGDA